jgi:hypothetical protein
LIQENDIMQENHHISTAHFSLAKEAKADELVAKEIQGIWPFSFLWLMVNGNW